MAPRCKIAPRWPMMASRWPKMAPRWRHNGPKMASWNPENGALAAAPSKFCKIHVLFFFNGMLSRLFPLAVLKGGQDGPKMAPRWPKTAPRWLQDGLKRPASLHVQRCELRVSRGEPVVVRIPDVHGFGIAPKWPQDGFKMGPRSPKMLLSPRRRANLQEISRKVETRC